VDEESGGGQVVDEEGGYDQGGYGVGVQQMAREWMRRRKWPGIG
jgi:hypothetical protein